MPVSVIIPTLDEAERIGATIGSAFAAGAAEVIVCDGGSSDETTAIAQKHGARVIEGERMRARQLNRGAEAASGDALIFLHADTRLPDGACAAVAQALETHAFGGFRLRFAERTPALVWTALAVNARTRLSRCPWGDQAQFIRRDDFLRDGGYRELPIMEDYELAVRMKRRGSVVLPLHVTTSGRRFLRKGVVRTTALNWWIVFNYRRGVDAETLARWYRT